MKQMGRSKNPHINEEDLKYFFAFVTNGGFSVVLQWIENGYKESPAEITDLIIEFSANGLRKYNIDEHEL